MKRREDVRNIAIIAHVDHGKTTLVDGLLRQAGAFRANQEMAERVMDSNDLERERGITILAKNAAVVYKGTKINIIDTPGHADFSGEVERVLKMADGCLLVVDAVEGPMPQTRFVLRKALEYGLKPILVINKIDRPQANCPEVLDRVYSLFIDLGATDEQIEFPVLYVCAMEGTATKDLAVPGVNLEPLFETILDRIPGPLADFDGPVQFQVTSLDFSDFVGKIAIGRLFSGRLKTGTLLGAMRGPGAPIRDGKLTDLYTFSALSRQKATHVDAGDLAAVAGFEDVSIGDTIVSIEDPRPLPPIDIGEPTVSMEVRINDSPLAGTEGKYVTSRHLKDRLDKEMRTNVAMRLTPTDTNDRWILSGRGFLHLGVVLETMRREGYEMAVARPEVILKEIDGKKCEPIELMVIDVAKEYQGAAMELVGPRRAEMLKMENHGAFTTMEFRVPSRGLIGLRSQLLTATRGEAVMYHVFHEYAPMVGDIPQRPHGVLVSSEAGKATGYSLDQNQERGYLFIEPGDVVYEGLVVGATGFERDILVNPCRPKRLTNMRASASDMAIQLAPPKRLSLEEALEFIESDELVEMTPKSIRIRKKIRDEKMRKRDAATA